MLGRHFRQFAFRFRRPLVSLASFCLSLLLAEVLVQSLIDVPRIHELAVSEAGSPYQRSSNPILRYELKPGFKAGHRNGVTRTNDHGNRDRPRLYAKPDGVERIILLGDSVVESVNLLDDHETINIRLEELFADDRTEVLNLAVAGYCTRAEVELLRVKGLKYQPDTVVVVFVENDYQNVNPEHSFSRREFDRPPGVNSLFRHSHVFRLLCVQMNWFGFGSEVDSEAIVNTQALGDNNVSDGFRLLRKLADEHEFHVIVGVWPAFTDTSVVDRYTMPDDPGYLVVEHLAWSYGIPTFRFSPDFQNDWAARSETTRDLTPRQFYTVDADTMHPSPPAAQIAARTLHAVLTGRQATELRRPSPDASGIASMLGAAKEPPDPLLERQPAYDVLLKQNRPREAAALVQRLLDEDPSNVDAWCLMAGSYGARGNLKKAVECYDHALRIDPQHVEALVWRGTIAFASGESDAAVDYFQRALRQDPDHARACFHLGLALMQTSPKEAAACFRRATELFPRYVDAYDELAKILLGLNQPQDAESACRHAIEIDHENPETHFHLGVSQMMQGQFDQAVTAFDEAIRLNPEFFAARLAAADACQQQGDIATSIQHLRRAIDLQPDGIDAMAKLAWILATEDDSRFRDGKEALRLAQECLKQVEDHRTLEVLAAALAETGDFASAVQRQEQAIERAPARGGTALESRLQSYRSRKPHRDQ